MKHDTPDISSGAVLPVDARLVARVETLLANDDEQGLRTLLDDFYPADVARLIGNLDEDDARRLYALLPTEEAAEVLTELDGWLRERLLGGTSAERIVEILDELDTDDAADVLSDLDTEVAQAVLPQLEDAEDVRDLLLYAGDTAGGIMGAEIVTVRPYFTVGEATEEVRRQAEHVDEVYAIFVTERDDRLVGIVGLKQLLLSPGTTRISSIMDDDFVTVRVDADQEEVARIMERYDLVSLPVVDLRDRLVGRITIDDVVDVLREEAQEDLSVITGTSSEEELGDNVLQISRGRLPWLTMGLMGTMMSAFVVGQFEDAIAKVSILAAFIPVVTAMAGNAAIQSAAITVQGLASGRLLIGDAFRRVGKELLVAMLNGMALAVVLLIFLMLFHTVLGIQADLSVVLRLATTVSVALLLVIILATTNGALIPVIMQRFGVDPAVSMGPFVTTANDILGLMVYFLVASFAFL